ncbi:MAG: hypothetical protein JRN09_00850 [Nitrososphaerota archaeon]|nr:hypothetical protein [Nitrososphaerota archaeon]
MRISVVGADMMGSAIACLVGIYATGFIGFWIANAYRRRSGLDLTLLHREIPPE